MFKAHGSDGRVETGGSPRPSLRLAAWLMLLGQLLYIAVTQFHASGDANDHHAIFATYAANAIWTAVHLGQFAGMAIMLSGLLALFFTLEAQVGPANRVNRLGAAAAVAALALYGALQAVDGVALKQAVNAWAAATDADKAARFASAEAIRWLEWGVRSYQDFVMGLAPLLLAAAVAGTILPWPVAGLMGLSGLAYLVQAWLAGAGGFTAMHSVAIVLAWGLSLAWMIWLVVSVGRPSQRHCGPAGNKAWSADAGERSDRP